MSKKLSPTMNPPSLLIEIQNDVWLASEISAICLSDAEDDDGEWTINIRVRSIDDWQTYGYQYESLARVKFLELISQWRSAVNFITANNQKQ